MFPFRLNWPRLAGQEAALNTETFHDAFEPLSDPSPYFVLPAYLIPSTVTSPVPAEQYSRDQSETAGSDRLRRRPVMQ